VVIGDRGHYGQALCLAERTKRVLLKLARAALMPTGRMVPLPPSRGERTRSRSRSRSAARAAHRLCLHCLDVLRNGRRGPVLCRRIDVSTASWNFVARRQWRQRLAGSSHLIDQRQKGFGLLAMRLITHCTGHGRDQGVDRQPTDRRQRPSNLGERLNNMAACYHNSGVAENWSACSWRLAKHLPSRPWKRASGPWLPSTSRASLARVRLGF
jgi:hypothetical protein